MSSELIVKAALKKIEYATYKLELIGGNVIIIVDKEPQAATFYFESSTGHRRSDYLTRDGAALAAARWYDEYVEEDSRR